MVINAEVGWARRGRGLASRSSSGRPARALAEKVSGRESSTQAQASGQGGRGSRERQRERGEEEKKDDNDSDKEVCRSATVEAAVLLAAAALMRSNLLAPSRSFRRHTALAPRGRTHVRASPPPAGRALAGGDRPLPKTNPPALIAHPGCHSRGVARALGPAGIRCDRAGRAWVPMAALPARCQTPPARGGSPGSVPGAPHRWPESLRGWAELVTSRLVDVAALQTPRSYDSRWTDVDATRRLLLTDYIETNGKSTVHTPPPPRYTISSRSRAFFRSHFLRSLRRCDPAGVSASGGG